MIIRPAISTDMTTWLALRNLPDVRAASTQSAPVADQAHAEWFTRALRNPVMKLLVAEAADGELAGWVRRQMWSLTETHIAVHPDYRYQGVGGQLLQAIEKDPLTTRMLARIGPSNSASLRLFLGQGYTVPQEMWLVKHL